MDDDPKAAELGALRVQSLAGTVLRAYGGREAIVVAREELPDLILLDLMMPEVNGFDVVEALKGQPDTARIPIVVVTARQITHEERAKLNGCVAAIVESEVRSRQLHRGGPPGDVRTPARPPDMSKVLIVEDNPANMTLAVFLLESAGHARDQRDQCRGRPDPRHATSNRTWS